MLFVVGVVFVCCGWRRNIIGRQRRQEDERAAQYDRAHEAREGGPRQ